MNNIFQKIIQSIITIFTVVTLPVTSFFTTTPKPTMIPTPTITISPIPSTSPSPTLTITLRSTPTKQQKVEAIIQTPSFVLPTDTIISIPTVQTYRILSLSELVNMNGANELAVAAAYVAYNLFLQTPNLQYMTPSQQQQIFTPLLTTAIQNSLNQQKEQLQKAIDQKQAEINNLTQPTQPFQPTQNNNQSAQNIQTCFNNKASSINSNPFLSESSRQAQIAKAYQDCVNQNQ